MNDSQPDDREAARPPYQQYVARMNAKHAAAYQAVYRGRKERAARSLRFRLRCLWARIRGLPRPDVPEPDMRIF